MNKNIKYWLLLCLLGGILLSCSEKELTEYTDNPSLYFERETLKHKENYQEDNILYSFYVKDSDIVRDTVWVWINTMGFPQNFDRPITIIQDSLHLSSAPKAGVHYVGLDDKSIAKMMVIPSGKATTKIPIILLRDQMDKSTMYNLFLKIAPNDHFSTGIDKQLNFLVKFTTMGVKPSQWDDYWKHTFGEWGAVKMKFITKHLGLTEFGYTGNIPTETTTYFRLKAIELLNEYNKKNNTILKEDDGVTVVEFPQ